MDDRLSNGRKWLRANWHELEDFQSDQQLRKPAPPLQQEYDPNLRTVNLPAADSLALGALSLGEAIARRKSRRQYDTTAAINLAELSFMLWACQGVRQLAPSGKASLRTVPSGGARHTFETYLVVRRVEGLEPGIHRYLPFDNRLLCLGQPEGLDAEVTAACQGQRCAAQAAVLFIWTTVPCRAEWRYGPVSHKMIAIDAGHACQNLYLACESVDCGMVAIGAYDQQSMDRLLGVDGVEEFALYAAPVGKLPPQRE